MMSRGSDCPVASFAVAASWMVADGTRVAVSCETTTDATAARVGFGSVMESSPPPPQLREPATSAICAHQPNGFRRKCCMRCRARARRPTSRCCWRSTNEFGCSAGIGECDGRQTAPECTLPYACALCFWSSKSNDRIVIRRGSRTIAYPSIRLGEIEPVRLKESHSTEVWAFPLAWSPDRASTHPTTPTCNGHESQRPTQACQTRSRASRPRGDTAQAHRIDHFAEAVARVRPILPYVASHWLQRAGQHTELASR